jgi:hypothetical protein
MFAMKRLPLILLVLGSVTYFFVLWVLGIRVKDFMKRTVI